MKFCIYCGKQLDDKSSFCIYCGKKQAVQSMENKGNQSADNGSMQNAGNPTANYETMQNASDSTSNYGSMHNVSDPRLNDYADQSVFAEQIIQQNNIQRNNIQQNNIQQGYTGQPQQMMQQPGQPQQMVSQQPMQPSYGGQWQNNMTQGYGGQPQQMMQQPMQPNYGSQWQNNMLQGYAGQPQQVMQQPVMQSQAQQTVQTVQSQQMMQQPSVSSSRQDQNNRQQSSGNKPSAPDKSNKKDKKGNAPFIIAVTCASLAVIGMLIMAYFLFIKKDTKSDDKKADRPSSELAASTRDTIEATTEATTGSSGTTTDTSGDTTVTASEASTEATTEATTEPEPDMTFAGISERVGNLTKANVTLVNADASAYPEMKLYFTVENEAGEAIELVEPNIAIKEKIANGQELECEVKSFEQIKGREGVRFELVADKSGSMRSDLPDMQRIMKEFVSVLDYATGDRAEFLAFDTYVMYMCTYTDDINLLQNGIDNMTTYGETALYDALYEAVLNAGNQTGAKCVIAFTDGLDNQSRFTENDVINLAKTYNVPIFIIGTYGGDDSVYTNITSKTGGQYWYIGSISDMSAILEQIYAQEKSMYCLDYVSDPKADPYAKRDISVAVEDKTYGSVQNSSFEAAEVFEKEKHAAGYEVVVADISWSAANAEAIKRGGHLITITSQEEMDMAVKLAEDKKLEFVWMGGYTSVRSGAAYGHWITGESFDYQAWYPGEPSRTDNDGADEMYLMLWKIDDKWSWNDQRNDPIGETKLEYFKGKTGYIIEYEE